MRPRLLWTSACARIPAPIINGKGEFFRVRAKDAAALAVGVKRSVGFWEEQ
jgi:hypothetical protein